MNERSMTCPAKEKTLFSRQNKANIFKGVSNDFVGKGENILGQFADRAHHFLWVGFESGQGAFKVGIFHHVLRTHQKTKAILSALKRMSKDLYFFQCFFTNLVAAFNFLLAIYYDSAAGS